jgi:hypothetical protein
MTPGVAHFRDKARHHGRGIDKGRGPVLRCGKRGRYGGQTNDQSPTSAAPKKPRPAIFHGVFLYSTQFQFHVVPQ